MDRHMLVATDGTDGARGALHLALALARCGMESPLVLAVQEPVLLYDIAAVGAMAEAQLALERLGSEQLREAVEAQLAELGAETRGWQVRVEVGPPAAVIADAAGDRGAALILLGLGRHGLAERWSGRETALRVIQLAHAPVLAVHSEARALPQRALVAEDFSDFSREAGIWALDLLEPGGELHLAHVLRMPPTDAGLMAGDWLDGYVRGIGAETEARRMELEATGKASVHTHMLRGEPAPELLRLAGTLGIDLIAAGRHGRGFLGRLLIGSVSTHLVRRAQCSVLVVPPHLSGNTGDAP